VKVLIAEDDLMIADMVEERLVAHGYTVCGIATTVADAVVLALREKPDLAIIDYRLADGELGTDILKQLNGRLRLGVLFATGNASSITFPLTAGHACISKPYTEAALLHALDLVSELVATGKASKPFPRGFKVLAPPWAPSVL
jgi:DNA-binding response OmpR family regulator